MTKQECSMILANIYALYSGKQIFKENLTKQDIDFNASIFYKHFKNYSSVQINNAINELVSKREQIFSFADLIGAIKQTIVKNIQFPQPSFEQVWTVACKKCSMNYQIAKKNYNGLPIFLKKVYGGTSFLTRLGEADSYGREFLRKEVLERYETEIQNQKTDFAKGLKDFQCIAMETGMEKQLEIMQKNTTVINTQNIKQLGENKC